MTEKPTIEAAIIEGNSAKNPDKHVIDYNHRAACMNVLIDAARYRIKRKPTAKGNDDMDYYRCPKCENIVGIVGGDVFDENKCNRFCYNCGQALDWGDE